MTTFDESLHPRANDGTFTEKQLSQAEAALPPVRTHIIIDVDGGEYAIESADATDALARYIERGGKPAAGMKLRDGATAAAVVSNQYGTVARLSDHLAAGNSLDGCEVHLDPLVAFTGDVSEGATELEPVARVLRDAFPSSVSSVTLYHHEDAETLTAEVTLHDGLTWNDRFTEEMLDEHDDIVRDVYMEWFGADIEVREDWSDFTASVPVEIPRDVATELYIASRTYDAVANWMNRTDPGTFGSPYVGEEILRRIKERTEASAA